MDWVELASKLLSHGANPRSIRETVTEISTLLKELGYNETKIKPFLIKHGLGRFYMKPELEMAASRKASVNKKAEGEGIIQEEEVDVVNTFQQLDVTDRRKVLAWFELANAVEADGDVRSTKAVVAKIASLLESLGYNEKKIKPLLTKYGLARYWRLTSSKVAEEIVNDEDIDNMVNSLAKFQG
jgi:nucleotide-binding universal stress UspA family protein